MQFIEEEKRGTQRNKKIQQIVSMQTPLETLERPDDHAHADANSHEKPVLLERTQNMDPLLRIASGDQLEDSKFQISAATSLGSERFFLLLTAERTNCLAQEDQEQGK